jgi:hypothetical protein
MVSDTTVAHASEIYDQEAFPPNVFRCRKIIFFHG